MSDVTPNDYEPSDGVGYNGIDECPHCGQSLHPEDHAGIVYDSDGVEYEHITETDPTDRPFFCPNCWDELEANRKAQENQQLGDFA